MNIQIKAILNRLNLVIFIQGNFMRNILLVTLFLTLFFVREIEAGEEKGFSNESSKNLLTSLQQKQWIHGSQDCKANKDPAIEVFQYDESSYVLRQNKCLSYEAPFIYVLIGDEKILVVDTNNHEVSAILGTHIEMTKRAGEYYDVGTIYQSEESSLPLMPIDLAALNEKLDQADEPVKISWDGLIVEPLGALPKLISNIVGWFIRE